MFRRELLEEDNARLKKAAHSALGQLEFTTWEIQGTPDGAALDASGRAQLLAALSSAHGFAHLAIDGKLDGPYAAATRQELLETVLPQILLQQWPD